MLTSVRGTYRHGQIELQDAPSDVQDETPVIVTFLGEGINLTAQGISASQAAELRAALATFEDWNVLEMDVYDNYDAAKAIGVNGISMVD